MNSNYFVTERLSWEHAAEALRNADRARLVKLAETSDDGQWSWSKARGKVMPDAAGAREVPSL